MNMVELEELIKSSVRSTPDNEGWFTVVQAAEALKMSKAHTSGLISHAVRLGLAKCERRITKNVFGGLQSVPMYKYVKGATDDTPASKRPKAKQGTRTLGR